MRLYLLLVLFAAGCGHAPTSQNESDPKALFAEICRPGVTVKSAKGSVWLKAKSKEASGQFPAVVSASSIGSSDKLKIEVTNLLGGPEATISVEGRRYKIEVPNHRDRNEQGESSWGGIPLQWANLLFIGRIPCAEPALAKDAIYKRVDSSTLSVETPKTLDRLAETYVYHLKAIDGGYWADGLHWERKGIGSSAPIVVDFKFEDPESKTLSPLKWEAKGTQGEVKVRWKDRQVEAAQ